MAEEKMSQTFRLRNIDETIWKKWEKLFHWRSKAKWINN